MLSSFLRVSSRAPCNATYCRRMSSKLSINALNDAVKSAMSPLDELKQRSQSSQKNKERNTRKPHDKQGSRGPGDFHNKGNNHKKPFNNQSGHQSKGANKFKQAPAQQNPLSLLNENRYDPATFKWTEGANSLENDYMTAKIKEVHGVNPSFKILHYTDESLQQESLRAFIKSLKPEESFDIVNVQETNKVQYPFVRIVNKESALKNYNEKLALEKSKLFGRTREKKREGGIKYLKISWGISFSDLENQKTSEILGLLQKDQKVIVIIDSKENLNKKLSELLEEKSKKPQGGEEKFNELELLKREKIFNHMMTFKDQKMDVVGDIKAGLVITITPKVHVPATEERKPKKNNKNLERQMKQKLREEQKKQELEAKNKAFNELNSKL